MGVDRTGANTLAGVDGEGPYARTLSLGDVCFAPLLHGDHDDLQLLAGRGELTSSSNASAVYARPAGVVLGEVDLAALEQAPGSRR
ncbi:hypothetical protein [Hoyosella subflava]|uniref:Uncharacterized protein n=1 Tax=Hoyosella subflava (strain DSM 45089 / JCM 17490 / NBRC 109087 / DQS3-9A1) TaxID=443218 RepID=F6EMP0_HOYSD|nr:hypothetical protein [Hoyosella subflava]AEF41598.1 hypothetical protein AS9A_3153 [Hoyosella subflava DQS3-9A1]